MTKIEFHIEPNRDLELLRKMPELKGPFYTSSQLRQIILRLNIAAKRQVISSPEENPGLQTVLENAGAVYLFQKSFQDRGTEWTEVQRALRNLDKASSEFRDAVDDLNPIVRRFVAIIGSVIQKLKEFDDERLLELRDPGIARYELGAKLGHLYHLAKKLSIAGRALSTRPASRPPSRDFDAYLVQLRKIYEYVADRDATLTSSEGPEGSELRGHFLDFVRACLEPIDPERCDARLAGSVKSFLYPDKKKNSEKSDPK